MIIKSLKSSKMKEKKQPDLAVTRTMLAAERSLMSWIRTGVSMIGFGFTIYAFLESLITEGKKITLNVDSPRIIGMFLLALGALSIIAGGVQYLSFIKNMRETIAIKANKFPLLLAAFVGLLGIVLFITLFINIHFL